MANSKTLYLATMFICFLFLISTDISAEQSLKAQDIAQSTPDYISQVTVEDKGEGV